MSIIVKKKLMKWCRECTSTYEGVEINDFQQSWSDGLAFNALIHHFRPDLFSYGEVLAMPTPEERLKHAFDLAEKQFGIEPLLSHKSSDFDKKQVPIYLMLFMQALDSENAAEHCTKTSPATTPTTPPFSGIPVLTPRKQQPGKATKKNSTSGIPVLSTPERQSTSQPGSSRKTVSSNSSQSHDYKSPKKAAKLFDSSSVHSASSDNNHNGVEEMVTDFCNDIEDILIWLLGTEDRLKSSSDDDKDRIVSLKDKLGDDDSRNVKERIKLFIEAAKYAQDRFFAHEAFMGELAQYIQKIQVTYEKGEKILKLESSPEQSADSENSAFLLQESKVEIEQQIKLLDFKVEQLRNESIMHQQYLEKMIFDIQKYQLEEFRALLKETEERVQKIIPSTDYLHSDEQEFKDNFEQFKRLQADVTEQQQLLEAIPKVSIVEESPTATSPNNDLIQDLEQLFERLKTLSKKLKAREDFFTNFNQTWLLYESESIHLQDWFRRLEKRAKHMQGSLDEVPKRNADELDLPEVRQERTFLEDLHNRFERMQTEVLYGAAHSQAVRTKRNKTGNGKDVEDFEPEMEKADPPLSKIQAYARTLIENSGNLLSKYPASFLCKVNENVEQMGTRWANLIALVCAAIQETEDKLSVFPKSTRDTVDHAPVSSTAKFEQSKIPKIKTPRKTSEAKQQQQQQKDKQPPETEVTKSNSQAATAQSIKFEEANEWRTKLEQHSEWIEKTQDFLYKLSIYKAPFFEYDSKIVIEDSPMEEFESVVDCLEAFHRFTGNGFDLEYFRTYTRFFNLISSDEPERTLEIELKELKELRNEFEAKLELSEPLIKQGIKIVLALKTANDRTYKDVEDVIIDFQKSLQIMRKTFTEAEMILTVGFNIESIFNSTEEMRRQLDEYAAQLKNIHLKIDNNLSHKNCDSGSTNSVSGKEPATEPEFGELLEQIKSIRALIYAQRPAIDDVNRRLLPERNKANYLSLCWPNLDVTDRFSWKQIECESIKYKVVCFINDRPTYAEVDISEFQWKCLRTTLEAMLFDKSWWTLLKACEMLQNYIERSQCQKSAQAKRQNAIEILLIAVKTMNEWFQEVLEVIEKYDDEDDECGQSVKALGSGLLEPADITKLINVRTNDLVELKKTIEGEQKNYCYMCHRSAEWIFDDDNNSKTNHIKEQNNKSLNEVEQAILDLEPKTELISKVQEIIKNWKRLNDRLDETMNILGELLMKTAMFEAEWTQIQRWHVKAKEFIDDYLPVGDSEMLNESLIECQTLQSRLEGEVCRKIRHIQTTTVQAAEAVYGQKLTEELPIVKKLETFYNDMKGLVIRKLNIIEHTKSLTEQYTKFIDNYSSWVSKFEQRIKRTMGPLLLRDKFIDLYEQIKAGKLAPNDVDWNEAITIKTLEKDFFTKRTQFEENIFGTNNKSLGKKLQKCFDVYGKNVRNVAYDMLMTKTFEIVESLENLEVQLQDMLKPVEENLGTFVKLHEMLTVEEKLNETMKARLDDLEHLRVSNAAEAKEIDRTFSDMLDDIENQEKIDRIKQIKAILMIKSELFLFAIKNHIKSIVEIEQERFKSILEFKESFKNQILERYKIIQEFKKNFAIYDQKLEKLRLWLEIAEIQTPLHVVNEMCGQLDQIESEYVPKLQMSGFTLAADSLLGRIELLRRNFAKFRDECMHEIQLHDDDCQPTNDLNKTIAELKSRLAEIHSTIHNVEIPFHQLDDPESVKSLELFHEEEFSENMELADFQRIIIPRFLRKVVHGSFDMIETELVQFENDLDGVRTQCRSSKNGNDVKNCSNLDSDLGRIRAALSYRIELVEKLAEYCDSINARLEKLEHDCNEIFFDSGPGNDEKDISDAQMDEFRRVSRVALDKICELKEQLDVHCIENADVLCGIDEVGGRYDEIITEIAERYLAYDDDEDMSEPMDHSQAGEGAEHGSSKVHRILNKNSVILTPIEEENDYGTLGRSESQKHSNRRGDVKGQADKQKEISVYEKLEKQHDKLKKQTYSAKTYLKQLSALKQKIHTVCTFRSGSGDAKRVRKLPISVQDELHRLNNSLNEFRVSYEYSLCIATILGCLPVKNFRLQKLEDLKEPPETKKDEHSVYDNYLQKWSHVSYEHDLALQSLIQEFCDSSIKFLSLHRHWWAVRDGTRQFNFESRKLAEWFENVELQLANGRFTTVVIDDPNSCFTFDLNDLNLPCMARTQLLLITQLRTNVPIYAKLNVLHARLVESFTPEDDDSNHSSGYSDTSQAAIDGRKAMLDACATIELEWKQISTRWNTIIRELTWRRECLLALARGKNVICLGDGQPYRRGQDGDFDKVLEEYLRYELQNQPPKFISSPSSELDENLFQKLVDCPNYQLKQLQSWLIETEQSLKQNTEQNIIDSVDSAAEVFQTIKQLQAELSRHYLNWFVLCKEPFIDGKTTVAITDTIPALSQPEMEQLTGRFEKLSTNLFEICYFAESFMTCYNYVCQLTRIEFDWVVTAHEHLNLLDDFLHQNSLKPETEASEEKLPLPVESLMFVDELKNSLMKHETSIEQISIMVKELRRQASNLSLKLNLDDFDRNYEKLSLLRNELLGRFRQSGYTVWAAIHHLLRESWTKLSNYRLWRESALKAGIEQASSSSVGGVFHTTGSLRSTSGYANSSLHRQRHAQRQEQKTFNELCSYYQVTLSHFQRWFELESFVLLVLCSKCEQDLQNCARNKQTSQTFRIVQFQQLLRRFEDFCCELSFADLVLGQVVLCFEQSVSVADNSGTSAGTSFSEPGTPLLRKNIGNSGGTLKNGVTAGRLPVKPEHSVSPSKIATNSGYRRPQTGSPHSPNSSIVTLTSYSGNEPFTGATEQPNDNHPNSFGNSFSGTNFSIQHCTTIKNSIMERIRGLQREINNHNQKQAIENLYDTVADALSNNDGDDKQPNNVTMPSYNKPFESSANNPSNLDSQRQEIECSLAQLEKKLNDFTVDCNNSTVPCLSALKSKGSPAPISSAPVTGNRSASEETLATLRKQLTIVSTYQSELTQCSTKLQELRRNIDSRIGPLAKAADGRKLSDPGKTSSTPYLNHLEQVKDETNSMQSRVNELYLTLKCKMRSLQEMLTMITYGANGTNGTGSKHNSASSRINLSGMNHGLDLGIDMHNTSSTVLCSSGRPPKTAPKPNGNPSIRALTNGLQNPSNNVQNDSQNGVQTVPGSGTGPSTNTTAVTNYFSSSLSNSSSSNSNQTLQASQANSGYMIHEQTEKRFQKWLSEIEQSLEFIEKRMEAECSGKPTEEDADPLYTNVSEMQQMHLNYFEKVKIMQREIEQKRADHRILMELLETSESETSDSTSGQQQQSQIQNQQQQQQQQSGSKISPRRPNIAGNNSSDNSSWIGRFRARVEQLNSRWNSVRLRVLTLRSRLESTSLYANSVMLMNTTTTPSIGGPPKSATQQQMSIHHHQQQQQQQQQQQYHSIYQPLTLVQRQMQSMYSMNGSIYGVIPPMGGLSLHGQEMDAASTITATVAFNSAAMERGGQLLLSLRELVEWMIKRQTEFEQQQANNSRSDRPNAPIALDVSNVLQQKQALLSLRSQLTNKRSIIDSTLMACHNLLRRLSSRRAQDSIYQNISGANQNSAIPNSVSMQLTADNSDADGKIEQLRNSKRAELADLELSISREIQRLMEVWDSLQIDVEVRLQRLDEAHLRLADLQRALEELGAKLHEAELKRSKWTPLAEITIDMIPSEVASLNVFTKVHCAPVGVDSVSVNELAARLTGRNVPLSHSNLKSLEEITTRVRLLQLSVDERARDLERIIQEHGSEQQDFLTKAVDEPWERAVTSNKLPCYINHQTELYEGQSPKYLSIIDSLTQYNIIRYAAYRTAFKLRALQTSLGLDQVTYDILAHVFEQKEMLPSSVNSSKPNNISRDTSHSNIDTTNGNSVEDSSYELKVIGVTEVVSCLKMIFDMVAETVKQEQKLEEQRTLQRRNSKRLSFRRKKSDADKSTGSPKTAQSPSDETFSDDDVARHVDLCLNWIIALYDSPNRSGYVRQFSFQVALVLLSRISLEQKFQYIFNLLSDDNGKMDGRKLGLLLYDCLRLPKVLGEVAAFGGTNIEPSVRSCLNMAGANFTPGISFGQMMDWIRAEPQSLVWMLVLHRFRLAEKSRHPAKCNVCKAYPIVGFRYRCLKCFNFDLCQSCYLTDAATVQRKTKHKTSHPMQEYCIATTSGEDMRDFGKIIRNKFKSNRSFKRQEELGYLPVQSLREGDRIEDNFMSPPRGGSLSHNPSANTTPVHTLQYPSRGRKVNSPGALTQQDMNFMLDFAGPSGRTMNVSYASATSSSSMIYPNSAGSVRRHNSTLDRENPYSVRSPFDRRLPQYQSTPTSPMSSGRSTSRTMERAKDLSEHKMMNSDRQMIESPSEMLSKIAADQRCELEHIIQRLEEENKSLVCEYNQLKEDEKENTGPGQKPAQNGDSNPGTNGDASLYDRIMNSLERRKTTGSVSVSQHVEEETRRLTENKCLLENRKVELEKCNQLLENQLSQFKHYANFSTEMDAKSKMKLANTIAEMQEQFKNGNNKSSIGPPLPPRTIRTSSTSASGENLNGESSTKLHSAAQHLNMAMDSLVDAVIDRQAPRVNGTSEQQSPDIQS